jgi:hypothetical protein
MLIAPHESRKLTTSTFVEYDDNSLDTNSASLMSKQCIEHLVSRLMTVASSVLGGTAGARGTANVEAEDDEDVVMLWTLYFACCQNRGGQMSRLLLMHSCTRR